MPPVLVGPTPQVGQLREEARTTFCAEVNDLGNLVLTSTDVGQEVETRLYRNAQDAFDAFRRFVDSLLEGLPSGLCPELG